jgi:hypothetical protein
VAAPLAAGAPAAGVVVAPVLPLVPPLLQATSTPVPADSARPFNRLRRLSRARCQWRSSLTVLTPLVRMLASQHKDVNSVSFLS